MNKRNLAIVLIAFLITSGCSQEKGKNYFMAPTSNKKAIAYENIILDSISFQQIESSYVGFAKIVSGSIYFIDQKFGYIFSFNENGTIQDRHLGFGRGPNELNTSNIEAYEYTNDGKHIFIGNHSNYHVYHNNFKKDKSYLISNVVERIKTNGTKINPDDSSIYTLLYRKFILRNYKNHLYFTIYSEHPYFNFIKSPKKYFENCRIIAKMNLSNGKIENLLGRYSPKYLEDPTCKQISFTNFDINNRGDFYVSQEADSLIHKYNNSFEIIKSFGHNGKKMEWPTHKLTTVNDFRKFANDDRNHYGYFSWIEYIDETNLLFRSYKRGLNSPMDGLQIYRNDILIADIDVPKNFRVLGYIAPYYYSNIYIDEENEKMSIYKFQLL